MNRVAGFLCLLLILVSCGKGEAYLPDVPVNYTVDMTTFSLGAENGVYTVQNAGIAGLLIVKTAVGYRAYDRCSPVNPQERCKVTADEGGITVTDPCTGAKWLLFDGSPQKAPAVHYLKSYTLRIQGSQIIQVTN
jgi:hypothetical protein